MHFFSDYFQILELNKLLKPAFMREGDNGFVSYS